MPRQYTHRSNGTYNFSEDSTERLVRFKGLSGLSWPEIARRIGAYPHSVALEARQGPAQHGAHDGPA